MFAGSGRLDMTTIPGSARVSRVDRVQGFQPAHSSARGACPTKQRSAMSVGPFARNLSSCNCAIPRKHRCVLVIHRASSTAGEEPQTASSAAASFELKCLTAAGERTLQDVESGDLLRDAMLSAEPPVQVYSMWGKVANCNGSGGGPVLSETLALCFTMTGVPIRLFQSDNRRQLCKLPYHMDLGLKN